MGLYTPRIACVVAYLTLDSSVRLVNLEFTVTQLKSFIYLAVVLCNENTEEIDGLAPFQFKEFIPLEVVLTTSLAPSISSVLCLLQLHFVP
jgi:hypothetical protein